jgi:type VI secretion system secreted protein Hcp
MAQVDMFLKIDGIEGEAQDEKHKNEIAITSYSMEVANVGSGGGTMGSSSGKALVRDIQVSMVVNKASPNLFIACCTGKHFATAWLYVRKAGEKGLEYETIKLTDVFVSSFSKTTQHDGVMATDTVSLNFSKIEYTYKPQNADGSAGASITKTYDVKANRGT